MTDPLNRFFPSPAALWDAIYALWKDNRLTLEMIRTSYIRNSHAMYAIQTGAAYTQAHEQYGKAFMDAIDDMNGRLLLFCADTIDEPDSRRLLYLLGAERSLYGSKYVLAGLQAAILYPNTVFKPVSVTFNDLLVPKTVSVEEALPVLLDADVHDLDTDEKRAAFTTAVRDLAVSPAERDVMLRAAWLTDSARALVLGALGVPTFAELLGIIIDVAGEHDVANDSDPQNGVIDIARVRALAAPDMDAAVTVLDAIADSGAHGSRAALIALAALGQRRESITERVKGQHQVEIKALGALPLVDGETVQMRYAALQAINASAKRYTTARRSNIQAAVSVALAHLAQLGGYASATQLEAAMQAETLAMAQTEWTAGDYTLSLDAATAELRVFKGGKRLKSVPTALRKTPEYGQARAATDSLRREISRVRREVIEGSLATGVVFSAADIARLWDFPAARGMMTALVWINADGATGVMTDDGAHLRGLDERAYPADAPLRLAHPYDLYQEGTLAAWQRFIVQSRLVQPVKQVFRELYILTPAELETETYSNRFANHSVTGATAARLFDARGWTMQRVNNERIVPAKVSGGLRALFLFGYDSYLSFIPGGVSMTSGRILFTRPNAKMRWDWQTQTFITNVVPLADVPPLFFSEVMRDADLITAVAQSDPDSGGQLSAESMAARAAVVKTLIEDLMLPFVTVDGHFARVTGKRANYRVHLGNAAIHIDPGNYLCIVPQQALRPHEKLYLPFADDGDRKVSEVISKIMLLLNDDKITDPTILRQMP